MYWIHHKLYDSIIALFLALIIIFNFHFLLNKRLMLFFNLIFHKIYQYRGIIALFKIRFKVIKTNHFKGYQASIAQKQDAILY